MFQLFNRPSEDYSVTKGKILYINISVCPIDIHTDGAHGW